MRLQPVGVVFVLGAACCLAQDGLPAPRGEPRREAEPREVVTRPEADACCSPFAGGAALRAGLTAGLLGTSADASTLKPEQVKAIVDDLISEAYPELVGLNFEVYYFEHKSISFRSNVDPWKLLWGKRQYRLGVNERVLRTPPPPNALRAVLAHELAHTLYYHQRTRKEIAKTLKIFWNREAQTDFERATDLVATARGFGPGLAEFRAWTRTQMPAEEQSRYFETYYDADDLRLLTELAACSPDLLLDWLESPPRSQEAIRERAAQ